MGDITIELFEDMPITAGNLQNSWRKASMMKLFSTGVIGQFHDPGGRSDRAQAWGQAMRFRTSLRRTTDNDQRHSSPHGERRPAIQEAASFLSPC